MNTQVYITASEKIFFQENGYLIKSNFVCEKLLQSIQDKVSGHLKRRVKPFELEQEVNYPGAPKTLKEVGGDTIRRLKLAYERDEIFKVWAENKKIKTALISLFDSKSLYLVQSHHNCVMTKQPKYSSETHWHKDIRYWNFKSTNLINTWLPLNHETTENGCLQVIPETHHWQTPADRFDERLFLRKDLDSNQSWLQKSIDVELKRGDVLFFHAALFHAAGNNKTKQSKNAVVFTYHSEKNAALAGTNSVKFRSIKL